ncbi:hypothetical protein Hdeb2414_s0002g00048971 [Helianthus debilis subsp. tardiflorus]
MNAAFPLQINHEPFPNLRNRNAYKYDIRLVRQTHTHLAPPSHLSVTTTSHRSFKLFAGAGETHTAAGEARKPSELNRKFTGTGIYVGTRYDIIRRPKSRRIHFDSVYRPHSLVFLV